MMRPLRHHPVSDFASIVDQTTQFIDVRQPAEVAQGSLRGARNIPLDRLPDQLRELDPNCRTVLLCRSGGRSIQAGEFLAAAGFVDIVNLDGGMIAYEKAGQS